MRDVPRLFSGNWSAVVLGALLGGSLIASTLIAAGAAEYVKTLDTSLITVTGSTQQVITSDQVKWTSNFSREVTAGNLKPGSDEMNKDLSLVTTFLASSGINATDVTVMPLAINPVYSTCGAVGKGSTPADAGCASTIVGYRLARTVVVDSADVQKVTSVAQNSSALIDQGVIFSGQPPQYFYSKLADSRVQLLAAATKDAQARAEKIAETAGAHLGTLESVSSGVFQITPVNSADTSNDGSYDTTTIQKQITAVVRASFALNPR